MADDANEVVEDVKEGQTVLSADPKVEDEAPSDVKDEVVEGDDKQEDKDESDKDEESKDEKSEVPEEYKFEFPEEVEVDEESLNTFKEWSKDHKISQEAAQELINMQVSLMEKMQNKGYDAWKTMTEEWATESKNDKEFGGKAFNESVAVAKVALDEFGSEGLREVLDSTGAGNHPEVIRFFHKVGKAISEDKLIAGGNTANEPKDPAKIMFPNMN